MNNIQLEILNDLKSAQSSIKVAVSWLTDTSLINELISARRKGVDVKIILSSNELNIIRYELFQNLIAHGATVNKWGNEDAQDGNFMHYKFYIIDDKMAKSGSYNWSVNAQTNKEALDTVNCQIKLNQFNETFVESIDFFKNIDDPAKKRNELETIQRDHTKDALTPEVLSAFRTAQKMMAGREEEMNAKIAVEQKKRKEAEEQLRKEVEKPKELSQQDIKKTPSQYEPKTEVKVASVPPTSYA